MSAVGCVPSCEVLREWEPPSPTEVVLRVVLECDAPEEPRSEGEPLCPLCAPLDPPPEPVDSPPESPSEKPSPACARAQVQVGSSK